MPTVPSSSTATSSIPASTSRLKPTRESFKIGPRRLGTLLLYPGERPILELVRSRKVIFLDKEGRLNHAIEADRACWSIETTILSRMRMREIPLLLVRVREDDETFLTTLQRFIDHSHMRNRRTKNGSPLRSLPFRYWARKPGKIKV
jgi:hypothetical protein